MLCSKKCPAVTAGLLALLVTSPTTVQAATNGASVQELAMLTVPTFLAGCATGAVAGAVVGHVAARKAVRLELEAFELRQRVEAAKRAELLDAVRVREEALAEQAQANKAVVQEHKSVEQERKPIVQEEVVPARAARSGKHWANTPRSAKDITGQLRVPRHARVEDWEATGNIRVLPPEIDQQLSKPEPIAVNAKPFEQSIQEVASVQEVAPVSEPVQEMQVEAAPKLETQPKPVPAVEVQAAPEPIDIPEIPAIEDENDYEQVAENYVQKMSFRELMATRARGVAAVLADRLGPKMDGIPIIERADGSTGDIGTVWWADAMGDRMRTKGFFDENIRPVDDFDAAAQAAVAERPEQALAAAAPMPTSEVYEQGTTNSLSVSAVQDRVIEEALLGDTSGAMPVLEATGPVPHTGEIRISAGVDHIPNPADQSLSFLMSPAFEKARVADLDPRSDVYKRSPEEAAAAVVNRLSSTTVEDKVSQMLAEERMALGVDEQRAARVLEEAELERVRKEAELERARKEAELEQARKEAELAAQLEAEAAAEQSHQEVGTATELQRDLASKSAIEFSHELIEEKVSEEVFPEIRDDTDPGLHVDIWKLALDALEERTSTDLRDVTFAFMDSVGDADSIDDPEGLEPSTAFLAFRRPAGHPEVVDTNSYVNFLLEKEFEGNNSKTAQERSREYLKVIEGGSNKAQPLVDPRARRSAKYRPSHFSDAQEA